MILCDEPIFIFKYFKYMTYIVFVGFICTGTCIHLYLKNTLLMLGEAFGVLSDDMCIFLVKILLNLNICYDHNNVTIVNYMYIFIC